MLRRWLATLGILTVLGVLAELVVLGVVVWQLGAAWTIGLLILKYVVGYVLVRRTGRIGWRQFRAAVDSGRPPGREGTDAAVGFGAAMLVLLAGFVGAVVGLVLLVPPVRRAASRLAERVVERQLTAVAANGMFGPRPATAQRVDVQRDAEPAADTAPPAALEGEILPPR